MKKWTVLQFGANSEVRDCAEWTLQSEGDVAIEYHVYDDHDQNYPSWDAACNVEQSILEGNMAVVCGVCATPEKRSRALVRISRLLGVRIGEIPWLPVGCEGAGLTVYQAKNDGFPAAAMLLDPGHIASDTVLMPGCVVMQGAHLHHESTLGVCSILAPAAVVLGRCQLGNGVMVGACATVLPYSIVPHRTMIGAGSVVRMRGGD